MTCFLPPERLPLLVTGISGVAGYNAFFYFHERYPGRVVGIRPAATWQLVGDGIVPLDTEDRPGLERLFRDHRFGSILNTTGNCALKPCELNPAMAWRINVASAANVSDLARDHGARLVHLSSDLVYSGTLGRPYSETDAVDPVTVYGKTMAEGEAVVLAASRHTAVLRISLPMGPSFNRHAGAIDWIQSRFRAGRPATLYFDEVRSCTYCDDLNLAFEHFLARTETGLYHCGGPRAVTLYEIAQIVNRVGGYEPALLMGCPRHAAGPMPPRAGDVSMDSSKLIETLGHNPFRAWPLGDNFFPTHRLWHFDRAADQPGSVELLKSRLYRYPDQVGMAASA